MDTKTVISEAVEVLRKGGGILFPTDTIWGIGCDACNEEAVEKVFKIKRRSGAKSLVLLASDLDMVAKYVKEIPSIAIDLVEVNDAPMTKRGRLRRTAVPRSAVNLCVVCAVRLSAHRPIFPESLLLLLFLKSQRRYDPQ